MSRARDVDDDAMAPPRRWLEQGGAGDDVRRLLSAARGGPDPAAGERIWRALAESTGGGPSSPPPALPPATPPVRAAGLSTTAIKYGSALVVAAALTAPVVYWQARRSRADAPTAARAAQRAPTRAAPRITPAREAPATTFTEPGPQPPLVAPPAARPATVRRSTTAPRIATPPARVAPSPGVATTAAPPVPVPTAPPASESNAAGSIPGASPAPDEPTDTAAEVALVTNARAALARGDAALALELATTHARRFPNPALAHEREATAIEALLRLGRASEARARAERFLHTHASSTAAPRVRELRDAAERAAASIR